jgi:hypothetical protein
LEDTAVMPPEPQPTRVAQPQQIRLPDSLMRAIRLVAADPIGAPLAAVEAAVLITYGYALYSRQDTLDPCTFALPTEQWTAIGQALLDVPNTTEITRVNLGLEWVNLGPSAVDDVPRPDNPTVTTTTPSPGMPRTGGDDEFPVTAWKAQVAAGRTRLGYGPWVSAQRILAQQGVLA